MSKSAEAETHFTSVADARALEELFALSHSQPIILFKHSTTCPVSAVAYEELSRYQGPVSLVVVQRARDISRQIEKLTGVQHESPQAIILRNGQAVWSASHWSITTKAIQRALAQQK